MTAVERLGRRAPLLITAGYAAVAAITMLRHEMWRDELQAWQIARASASLGDLLENIRYEGHPPLWFVLLWLLSKLTTDPAAMQVLHLVIATAAVGVVAWRSPFTTLQKALFASGYFALFEYGVIARNYASGLLLLVIASALIVDRPRRWPAIGAALALLALTSAFGVILAIALGAGLLLDRLTSAGGRVQWTRLSLLIGAAIGTTGVMMSYLSARPPGDSGAYDSWANPLTPGRAGPALGAFWRSLVPLPELQREFWNTNLLATRVGVYAVLGALLFLATIWVLRADPGAVTVWVVGAGGVSLFLAARLGYAEASRHIGHIFLALVAAAWLYRSRRATEPSAPSFNRAWTGLLALHVVCGLFAVGMDVAYPFSNAKQVADYLEAEGLQDAVIIGRPDISASTVAGFLDRPILYPEGGREGTFIIWDRDRVDDRESIPEVLDDFAARRGPVVLLVNAPFPEINETRASLIATFDDGIVADEHYYLYLIT